MLSPTVALVGSLQSELGCSDDWQPACADTELARIGDSPLYRATFDVPDGRYELKLPYSHARELLMDVLRYGVDAEVMEPESLRQQARTLLQLALSAYER
mgnify:CR=1 FL=1